MVLKADPRRRAPKRGSPLSWDAAQSRVQLLFKRLIDHISLLTKLLQAPKRTRYCIRLAKIKEKKKV